MISKNRSSKTLDSVKIHEIIFLSFGHIASLKIGFVFSAEKERPFFQATKQRPYHLSVGAVLFDQNGRIACHHFKEIFGI